MLVKSVADADAGAVGEREGSGVQNGTEAYRVVRRGHVYLQRRCAARRPRTVRTR